jgi:hypothetical protein
VSFDHGVNAGKEGGRHIDADDCRYVGANSSDRRAIVASVAKKYDSKYSQSLLLSGCVAATVSLLRAFASKREMAIKLGVICGRRTMGHFLALATILAATLAVLFVAISYNEASAQLRVTCSQARSNCGTQRICQKRYEACMETGCWTVPLLKKCGYEKR